MRDVQDEIKRKKQRLVALEAERTGFLAQWQDVTRYVTPNNGRYYTSDRNKGQKKTNYIKDSTASKAHGILAAGLFGGNTSPAKPWFKMNVQGDELKDNHNVKLWLDELTGLMLRIFQQSNTYRALHSVYVELTAFGTAACLVMPDFNDVIRLYPLTAGEYCIATDSRGVVNTLYRRFDQTVASIVDEFGIENVSETCKRAFQEGNLDRWLTVIHVIEPRIVRDYKGKGWLNMPFQSCYFELADKEGGKYLREGGFKSFPALCPRWDTVGGDIYGSSPVMLAMGDIKQLQHEQLRKAESIDYKTRPPLQVPTSMKNDIVNMLPGGINFADSTSAQSGIRTAYENNISLNELLMDIEDVRNRIKGMLFSDVFMMISSYAGSTKTAYEVAQLQEEKMTALGPVLERLDNELLSPLIDITFAAIMDAGILPTPPKELQGAAIKVDFVSMLAQAQKAAEITAADRFISGIMNLSQVKPELLDKLNADAYAESLASGLGINQKLVVSQEDVDALRQQRAQAQAQAQQQQAMVEAANTAQTLSKTQTDQPSALDNVMGLFSGYAE